MEELLRFKHNKLLKIADKKIALNFVSKYLYLPGRFTRLENNINIEKEKDKMHILRNKLFHQ